MNWINYGKTFKEFRHEGLAKPGVIVELEDTEPEQLLIGDINELGGVCDCCDVGDGSKVTRYAIVWEMKV